MSHPNIMRSVYLPHTDVNDLRRIAHERTMKQNKDVTRMGIIREFVQSALGDPATREALAALPKEESQRDRSPRGKVITSFSLPREFDDAVKALANDTGHTVARAYQKILSDQLDAVIPERIAERAEQAEWDKRGPHIDPNPATLMYS